MSVHVARRRAGFLTVAALLAMIVLGGVPARSLAAQADADITIESGTLPVVLSAPHGGNADLPGVAPRRGGKTVTDLNTYQLALAIQASLYAKTGQKAYLVAARVSRKYIDLNRPPAASYEDQAAAPVYARYYAALAGAVAAAARSPAAILLDIHGQSEREDAVFRGTRNGRTAAADGLYAAADGLLANMLARAIPVLPATAGGSENPHFDGGNIVATFGRSAPGGIDAVQLEFGHGLRADARALNATADKVSDAIIAHLKRGAPAR